MANQRGRKKQKPKTPAVGVEPLQGRNIMLHGATRTSMRLEPSMWGALEDIAQRETSNVNDLCSKIDARLKEQCRRKGVAPEESEVTLTSAVRVFIFAYYRAASTEAGHGAAGHGLGDPFVGTPFDLPPADDGNDASSDGGGSPPGTPPPLGALDSKAGGSAADLTT